MCCISLACNMHRDTLRKVDQCSDKLQRGTCAKNTVRYLKNDPSLTCTQCTVRVIQYKAHIPSENAPCDSEGHSVAADRDVFYLETTWAKDDIIPSTSPAKLPPVLSGPFCSRPASMQFDSQLPGHLQLGNHDLAELSHEDGIQLIDEMYCNENLDHGFDYMDADDDEISFVPAETRYDLKQQAHNMINEINETMQIKQRDVISDGSPKLPPHHGANSVDLDDSKEINIKENIIEAKELLWQAQQELENLWRTRHEIEPDFLWCLERYTTLTQISA